MFLYIYKSKLSTMCAYNPRAKFLNPVLPGSHQQIDFFQYKQSISISAIRV